MKFHLDWLIQKNTYSISGAPPPHVDLNGTVIKIKTNLFSSQSYLWRPIIDFQITYLAIRTRLTFT